MAQLPGQFDASTVDTTDHFEVLPADDYMVHIVQSEMRATKNGNGQYLWLELDVLQGKYEGRKLWDRVNIVNANPQAQQIGEKVLAQICKATGEISANDSEQFHFKPMVAKVKVQPASGQYDASNQIKSYRNVNGCAPAAAPSNMAQQPTQQQPQPAQQAGGALPWQQNQ